MSTLTMRLPPSASPNEELELSEHYEIVDGVRLELPPMSAEAAALASDLAFALNGFGLSRNIGKAYTEMLFHLPLPIDRNRRLDVGFVPFSRWPKNRAIPSTNAWDALPDLAVEVISPYDLMEEVRDKIEEYFRAGVRLVWIVHPKSQLVEVYEGVKQVKILSRDDVLDGGVVLPEFRLSLSELFLAEPDAT